MKSFIYLDRRAEKWDQNPRSWIVEAESLTEADKLFEELTGLSAITFGITVRCDTATKLEMPSPAPTEE